MSFLTSHGHTIYEFVETFDRRITSNKFGIPRVDIPRSGTDFNISVQYLYLCLEYIR